MNPIRTCGEQIPALFVLLLRWQKINWAGIGSNREGSMQVDELVWIAFCARVPALQHSRGARSYACRKNLIVRQTCGRSVCHSMMFPSGCKQCLGENGWQNKIRLLAIRAGCFVIIAPRTPLLTLATQNRSYLMRVDLWFLFIIEESESELKQRNVCFDIWLDPGFIPISRHRHCVSYLTN